jgi:beta-lactamase superfamily II metal-dependent hydrolase
VIIIIRGFNSYTFWSLSILLILIFVSILMSSASVSSNEAPPLKIITTSLQDTEGEVKVAFPVQTIEADYGTLPYKWSKVKSSLPGGLKLKGVAGTNTATISGKPNKAGEYNFTVRVTDKNKTTDDQEYKIIIHPAPKITTTSLAGAVVGVEYNQQLQAIDGQGPYTWSICSGMLPAGLDLDEETGLISGIPDTSITKAQTYKVVFSVTDEMSGTAKSKTLSLNVTLPLTIATASPLPEGDTSIKYSQSLKAKGGSGKYKWGLPYGGLPNGLSLSKTGVISGKAAAAGTSIFRVVVNDGINSLEKEFSLTINEKPAITTSSLPDGEVSAAYLDGTDPVRLEASGGDGEYTWSISGKLPAGLTLDKVTGIISGAPSKAGTSTFTIKVTDGLKAAASLKISLKITPVLLKISFLDIGQADCTVIQFGASSMIIDAGGNATASALVSRINSMGISQFDIAVATHPHEDHIGGMDAVINSFDIDSLYMPQVTNNTKTYEDVLTAIENKGLTVTAPVPGSTFSLGEDVQCTILAPNNSSYEYMNNYSIVIKMDYGDTSFLFTGDAESVSLQEMLVEEYDLEADVLKVSHHGAGSATSAGFLEAVSPEYGVIFVGEDNDYGYPDQDTLEKLDDGGVKVYRTDLDGTIEFISDGRDLKITDELPSVRVESWVLSF